VKGNCIATKLVVYNARTIVHGKCYAELNLNIDMLQRVFANVMMADEFLLCQLRRQKSVCKQYWKFTEVMINNNVHLQFSDQG